MSFGVRFGYLRWLRHLTEGEPPTFNAIGRAVNRNGVSVAAWLEMDEPPTDYRLHKPLAEFFNASARWIFDGEGQPPRPALWAAWVRARNGEAETGEGGLPPGVGALTTRPTPPSIEPAEDAGKRKRRA